MTTLNERLLLDLTEETIKILETHLLTFVDSLGDEVLTKRLLYNVITFRQIIDDVKHKLEEQSPKIMKD